MMSDNGIHVCGRCEKVFKLASGVRRHLQRKIPCRKPLHSCVNCNKLFVSAETLRRHMKLYCNLKATTHEVNTDGNVSSLYDTTYKREDAASSELSVQTSTVFPEVLKSMITLTRPLTPIGPSPTHILSKKIPQTTDLGMSGLELLPSPSTLSPQSPKSPLNDIWGFETDVNDTPVIIDLQDEKRKEQYGQNDGVDIENSDANLTSLLNTICNSDVVPPLNNPGYFEILQELQQSPLAPQPLESLPPSPLLINKEVTQEFDAMMINADKPVPELQNSRKDDKNIWTYFNDLLFQWGQEVVRMDGTVRYMSSKIEVTSILDELLRDGLINPRDHSKMIYVNKLFTRLHCLVESNPVNKREILEILLELFEMGKISKCDFIGICLQILE